MTSILTGLTNLLNNPILVGVGAILFVVAGFFARAWIMPWLQKAKDKENSKDIEDQSKKSQTDNQKANDDLGKIFD